MKTVISSKGQIVLPAKFRRMDGVKAGQEFNIERLDSGEYRLARLRTHEADIAVDPIILGELRFGILILPKGKKRTALEQWFDAGAERLPCVP